MHVTETEGIIYHCIMMDYLIFVKPKNDFQRFFTFNM